MKLAQSIKDTNLANEDQVEKLLDAYKEFLRELKMEISTLRKAQKDPIIPDMMLRKVPSKIQYAEISKEKVDFAKVEVALLEAWKEIELCKTEKVIDIKKDVEESFKKISQESQEGEEQE